MSAVKLELSDLKKSFAEVEAVKGLSFTLRRGEFLSLLGPSGCGKSTTLAMLAGFEEPTGGDILVDGKSVLNVAAHRRQIGLVFQDYAVFSRLKVRSNLAFGLEAQGVARAERKRRIDEMAERLDLRAILDQRAGGLNMSEMQRVALARVLVTEPQILLLDEPMSNLDAGLRYSLRSELKRIQQALNQTVLYVTHDQLEAISLSDRIAVMRLGVLQQIGSPQEIYRHPVNRFVAEFIGDPPINLLDCEVARDGSGVAVTSALHGPLDLGEAEIQPGKHLLAIRPHDLRLSRQPAPGSATTTVRVVENLGAEHVLHIDYGDRLALATVAPGFAAEGERLEVTLDPERLHLIDSASERVVTSRAMEATP
ncbi:MAG: ABC transporter ATP-binding protein [Rhodospirillales bacterium]